MGDSLFMELMVSLIGCALINCKVLFGAHPGYFHRLSGLLGLSLGIQELSLTL